MRPRFAVYAALGALVAALALALARRALDWNCDFRDPTVVDLLGTLQVTAVSLAVVAAAADVLRRWRGPHGTPTEERALALAVFGPCSAALLLSIMVYGGGPACV